MSSHSSSQHKGLPKTFTLQSIRMSQMMETATKETLVQFPRLFQLAAGVEPQNTLFVSPSFPCPFLFPLQLSLNMSKTSHIPFAKRRDVAQRCFPQGNRSDCANVVGMASTCRATFAARRKQSVLSFHHGGGSLKIFTLVPSLFNFEEKWCGLRGPVQLYLVESKASNQ